MLNFSHRRHDKIPLRFIRIFLMIPIQIGDWVCLFIAITLNSNFFLRLCISTSLRVLSICEVTPLLIT